MSELKVSGLKGFDEAFQGWFKAVEEMAEVSAKGIARQMLKRILYTSPQYSGDFVANWNLSVDRPDTSFKVGAVRPRVSPFSVDGTTFTPYKIGSTPAIEYALGRAESGLAEFKLGKTIYLTNMASHPSKYEGADGVLEMYSPLIEAGLIRLRPVNTGASHMVSRAHAVISSKYRTIGAGNYSQLAASGVTK